MTTATTATAPMPRMVDEKVTFSQTVNDALAITKRNVIVFTRVPTTIVFMTLQPIIFVLMFRYVFGGSFVPIPGIRYVDFLMCGIFVQTMCFSAQNTAIGLAADLQTGLIERLR